MFTIERLTAHVYWLAQINTGKYDTNPQSIPLFTNVFLGLFLIIGVIFIIISFQEKN